MLAWVAAIVAVFAAPTAASAATGYVLTCSCESVVTVIDTATRSVVTTVPVGDDPRGLAVARDGRFAYTANTGDGTISVIDGLTRTVARTIDLNPGDEPYLVAVSPDGATLYVLLQDASFDTRLVSVDVAGGAITGSSAPTEFSPFDAQAVISADGTNLYTLAGSELWRFDLTTAGFPDEEIDTVPDPTGIAVAPDGTLYVSDLDDEVFHLGPTGTPIGSPIPLTPGGITGGIALDAGGAHAWIVGTPALEATVVDLATEAALPTSGIDDISFLIAVSPDGDGVYVGSLTDAILHVVDPQTRAQVATIRLSDDPFDVPFAIAFGPTVTPPPPPPALGAARPVVTSVGPAEGPTSGGHEVRIEGANFATGVHVLFGDTPATSQQVLGFNAIVATAPPGAAGRVRVTVVGPDGRRSTEDVGYRYVTAPAPAPVPDSEPSTGPRCVVPDVRGLGLRGARKRLQAANCTVGHVSRLRGRRHQRVVRQSVRPGAERPGGWGVALAIRPRPAR